MADQVRCRIYLDIDSVAGGTGTVLLAQFQAEMPGYGQAQGPGAGGVKQTLRLDDAVQVPGTPGSLTVANFNTALTAAVADFAGATGTPLITPAVLAQINGWFTGQN